MPPDAGRPGAAGCARLGHRPRRRIRADRSHDAPRPASPHPPVPARAPRPPRPPVPARPHPPARPPAAATHAPPHRAHPARPPTSNGATASAPPTARLPSAPTPPAPLHHGPHHPHPGPPAHTAARGPGPLRHGAPTGPAAVGASRREPASRSSTCRPSPGGDHRRRRYGRHRAVGGAAACRGVRTTGRQRAPHRRARLRGALRAATRRSEAAPDGDDGAAATSAPHRARRAAAATGAARPRRRPVLIFVLLIGGWAVDTAALSGQVVRNVEVAGRSVGGLGEESLPDVMEEVNEEIASRPVVITSGDLRYETTAGEIGLTLDSEATAESALDAGRRDSLLARPLPGPRPVLQPPHGRRRVHGHRVAALHEALRAPGDDLPRQTRHDPAHRAGVGRRARGAGRGVDPAAVFAELPAAAEASPTGAIEVEAERVALAARLHRRAGPGAGRPRQRDHGQRHHPHCRRQLHGRRCRAPPHVDRADHRRRRARPRDQLPTWSPRR